MRTLLAPLLLAAAALAGDAERPLWVALGEKSLLARLEPLAALRRAQGMEVALLQGGGAAPLRALPRAPSYLLLVGDDAPGSGAEPWRLPAPRRELYRWRRQQAPTYADDSAWAECPVGRIPARTPEQVAAVVAKVVAYEARAPSGSDLRLVVWAGAPGYGGAVDAMATGLLVHTVRRLAPAWAGAWMISGDEKQPLCGWPPDQPALFSDAMREGSILNAAVAHAHETALFSMNHQGQPIWYEVADVRKGGGDGPAAPLVLLACDCARFDGGEETLAEACLFEPGGPVAVVGATTESHPLTNYFSGVAMLKALDGAYGRRPRLGDLWQEAQRRAGEERDALIEFSLRDVEGKLEETIDVAKLREDQRHMYALLGDPALRLPLPEPLAAKLLDRRWSAERVPGATRLEVALLAAVPEPAPVLEGDAAAQARARFVAANAARAFVPLATIEGDGPWEGECPAAGRLRLVAVGAGILRVAVLEVD